MVAVLGQAPAGTGLGDVGGLVPVHLGLVRLAYPQLGLDRQQFLEGRADLGPAVGRDDHVDAVGEAASGQLGDRGFEGVELLAERSPAVDDQEYVGSSPAGVRRQRPQRAGTPSSSPGELGEGGFAFLEQAARPVEDPGLGGRPGRRKAFVLKGSLRFERVAGLGVRLARDRQVVGLEGHDLVARGRRDDPLGRRLTDAGHVGRLESGHARHVEPIAGS